MQDLGVGFRCLSGQGSGFKVEGFVLGLGF